jgi:hypothetical protein
VESCNGIGKHLAQRLVADVEVVLDVPAMPPAGTTLGAGSPAPNWRINRVLHIMAVVQLRHGIAGRAYYE